MKARFRAWWAKNKLSGWAWIAIWAGFMLVISGIVSYVNWCWLNDGTSASETLRNIVLVNAALIGLPLALWRSHVAASQTKTAQQSLLNERYQKGAEMLGSENLALRFGGIHALARLAREHPRDYHVQIMNLFCAVLRTKPEIVTKIVTERVVMGEEDPPELSHDAQEIMTAIGERTPEQVETEETEYLDHPYFPYFPDLSGLTLFCAKMRKANLSQTDLSHTNLLNANLCEANLSHALLSGADLSEANLMEASLVKANLHGAQLSATNISGAEFSQCTGLTQEQLDVATAWESMPPILTDVVDAKTGKPLIWRGNVI